MISDQEKQIDNYLSGQMNQKEVGVFESKIREDASLKTEMDFQSHIIKGLKEYRKVELKTRLDAINIPSKWINTSQYSVLTKSLSIIISTILIGIGIYNFIENDTPLKNEKELSFDIPIAKSIIYDVIKLPKETTESSTTKPKLIEDKELKQITKTTSSNIVTKKNLIFAPTISVPSIANIEEEVFESEKLDELPVKKIKKSIEIKLENRKGRIKYTYHENKLFLRGDFTKNIYEIYEINTPLDRKIYIYYLSHYYKVDITTRLKELSKESDKKMIEKLELIRKNK